MIILIIGASHTGKTKLAQKLLEKYKYPYLSIDHLKMGLIRSGYTKLTAMSSDEELTDLLWPIISEMIKTAIENKQNLIVEGCYISFDWKKDFEKEYLENIKCICLVMSENYINKNFNDIIEKIKLKEEDMKAKLKYKAKKIKIVFFDIDDTLRVKETGFIPESIKVVFKQLREKGILTGIASGRGIFGVVPEIRDLDPDFFVT